MEVSWRVKWLAHLGQTSPFSRNHFINMVCSYQLDDIKMWDRNVCPRWDKNVSTCKWASPARWERLFFKVNGYVLEFCPNLILKWLQRWLPYTAQKMKFIIKDFSSKCDQIRSFLLIWSHLRKKSLMENIIFLCSDNRIQKSGKRQSFKSTYEIPLILL